MESPVGHSEVGRLDELMPRLYKELRRLAGAYLRAERPSHTLQPTALVHEAYLRLASDGKANTLGRGEFLAAAAGAMRRILVDHARAHRARKRGGEMVRIEIENFELAAATGTPSDEILAVDQAIEHLGRLDPQQARVVELRYFAGLTLDETADALGISRRTVNRDWAMAVAWLRSELLGKKEL